MFNYCPKCGTKIEIDYKYCKWCGLELKKATPEAMELHGCLQRLGIKCELEKWDGHKHVDIVIAEAKLNIEIDGSHHITNPKQLDADIKRDEYSQRKGWYTIHIRNHDIRQNLYWVANSIAEVVAKRKNN